MMCRRPMTVPSHGEAVADTITVSQRCGSGDLLTREKSPHVGLFYGNCDRWITWLPQGRPIEFMPFGKQRNSRITKLADEYQSWVLENMEGLKGSLRKALRSRI